MLVLNKWNGRTYKERLLYVMKKRRFNMTYEYYCKRCGCLWTSTYTSNRCPNCNSSDFDSGDFSEDYEETEDEKKKEE